MREVDEIQSQAWAACSLAGRLDGHFRRIKVINMFMKCWVSAPEHKSWRCFMQEELKTNTGDRNAIIVQSFSCVRLFATLWTEVLQASLFFTISRSLLKLMSFELMIPSTHLILCRPLLLLPSIFPSIRVFSSDTLLHIRWPNIGVSASASVLPMNIQDWFPLGWTGLISLQSKGLSGVFSSTTDYTEIKLNP